jgi:hypothetical protein
VGLSATVSPVSPSTLIPNEGTVAFTVSQGTTTLCTATSGPVAGGKAAATCALPPAAPVGSYTISAVYNGGPNFNDSVSSTLLPATLTIGQASTSLSVTPVTGTYGQAATLTAVLTANGAGLPGGSVTFTLNGARVGSATTDSTGAAALRVYLSANGTSSGTWIPAGTYASGVAASYSGAASYTAVMAAPTLLTVGRAAPQLTWATPADIAYGTKLGSAQLNASASVPGTFVYTPAAGSLLGVGTSTLSVAFTPTDTANYLTGGASVKLNVLKASVTVTLGNLSQTYDGLPKLVSVTTSPLGLPTTISYTNVGGAPYGPTASPPTQAGTYSVTVSVTDPNYVGSATATLTVAKASQTISFAPLADATYGDPAVKLSATASSGLPVTFSVGALDTCTIASTRVTITGAGSCTVTASQAGDTNWAPASMARTFRIAKASATLSLSGLSQVFDGTPKSATVTTSPAGLTGVTLSYTQSGVSVLAPSIAGAYSVVASLNNPNYQAQSVTGILVIAQATPSLTWANPAAISFGTPLSSTQLNATASVPGSFVYLPPAGTVLLKGTNQTLLVTFTPADLINYTTVTASVHIDVR